MNAETPEQELARLRKEKQQDDSHWWDGIKSLFSFDFGGTISKFFSAAFWIGILAAVYYVARENKDTLGQWFGKENVDKFFDWADDKIAALADGVGMGFDVTKPGLEMPLDDLKKRLEAKKLPAEVVDLMVANRDVLFTTARKANGGKASESQLTNDKTMFALMTEQPELTRKLALVAFKPGSSAASSEFAHKIKESLNVIIGDEARLTTLFTGNQKAHTLALLKQVAPASLRGDIDAIVNEGMKTGKPSAELRNILTRALDASVAPAAAAPAAGAAAAPAAGAAPSATGPAPAADFDKIVAEIEKDPKNQAAFAALKDTFKAQEKLTEFATAFGGNVLTQTKFAIENRPAFETFLAASNPQALPKAVLASLQDLKSLPKEADVPALAILNKGVDIAKLRNVFKNGDAPFNSRYFVNQLLTNPESRTLIAGAESKNVVALIKAIEPEAGKELTEASLNAIVRATASIAANKDMKNPTVARDAVMVTTALADLLVKKDPSAFTKVNNEQFTQFIGNATNMEALKQLLIDTNGKDDKVTAALIAHWDVIEVLAADKEKGALFLRDQLTSLNVKPEANSCKKDLALSVGDRLELAWVGTDWNGKNIIGKNADDIKALALDLKAAQCDSLPQAAALPARAAQSASANQGVSGSW